MTSLTYNTLAAKFNKTPFQFMQERAVNVVKELEERKSLYYSFNRALLESGATPELSLWLEKCEIIIQGLQETGVLNTTTRAMHHKSESLVNTFCNAGDILIQWARDNYDAQ